MTQALKPKSTPTLLYKGGRQTNPPFQRGKEGIGICLDQLEQLGQLEI